MKRKKLGVWNRLAVVFTVLITLGVPGYFGIRDDLRASSVAGEEWTRCRTASIQHGYNYANLDGDPELKKCLADNEASVRSYEVYIFTSQMPKRMIAVLVMCGLVYLLIWLTVSIVKWVSRGRQQEAT